MLVIPTYNERGNIGPLVARVRAAAAKEPILFVDDSSPDGTAEEIRRIRQGDPLVHLIVRPGKGGYASACRGAIVQILEEQRADYVIQFDADLSHPPELLPKMIELLKQWPVVIGSRYVVGGRTVNWSLARRMLSRFGNYYARLLTGIPARDLTAGFVGYRAEVLRRLPLRQMRSDGYAFLLEMKYSLHRLGVRFFEFPITFTERERGRSKFSKAVLFEGIVFPARILLRRVFGAGRD